jgi:hypothetical protein
MAEGLLNNEDMQRNIASMADWYDVANLDIAGESGDVVIETKYPRLECKQIHNYGSGTATVIFTTKHGSTVTIKIPTLQTSPKLPSIYSITKSGTSDDLVLFFQKR